MSSPPGDGSPGARRPPDPPPQEVFTEAQARITEAQARKRELRITTVAIVVTGLVSAAGVFVSWQSARDSQQTAREAQREAARGERARTDLTELRTVLDGATADLQRAAEAAVALQDRPPRPSVHFFERQPVTRLISAVRTSDKTRARLVIRLGSKAAAVTHFDRAFEHLSSVPGLAFVAAQEIRQARRRIAKQTVDQAINELANGRYPAQDKLADAVNAGSREQDLFIEEARKLVGSRLPE